MSARRACDLTWGDFLFNADDPDRVRVILKNEDIAGATHDFTRPCSRFCAREIKRRYNALDGQRGINRKTYILLKQDGKRVTPKELTAFCREALLNAGMSYSDLQPDRKEPNGVGVQLLNKNLHSRITNICGLGRDKGASKYSAVESLAGYTTSDHYRSLSCEEGQDFLQIIMNRDGRFEEAPQVDRELCEDHPDGTNTMCFLTTDYDRLTSGMVQYILAPGESIIVSAEGGVTGSVAASRVRKLSKGKKVSEETEILEETDVLEEKETPDETEALEETETFGKVETPEESAVASNNNIESVVVEETIDCDIQLSLFD